MLRQSKYILIGLIFFSSCVYNNEEELYGDIVCDTENVTYSAEIQSIIESSCATSGCHNAGGSAPNIYESYNNVKASVDDGSFENRVLVQKNMPPGTPLSDCNIALIEAWLEDGAPNN